MIKLIINIHCSAGVGRTGTFIGLDILIDEAHTHTKGSQPTVNIMSCVYAMRRQRRRMIQTSVCSLCISICF